MTMTPRTRKFALTAHIAASVGWLGAVAAFLVHAVAGQTSHNPQIVRSAYVMMEIFGWFVLVPLSLASLLTGVIQSLGTMWGLFRHYWVVVKLLITVVATVILLIYMKTLGSLAGAAADAAVSFDQLRNPSPVIHASAALLALLAAVALSVFKPWGRTWFGRREQLKKIAAGGDGAGVKSNEGTAGSIPRWGYVLGIIVIALALMFFIQHLMGGVAGLRLHSR